MRIKDADRSLDNLNGGVVGWDSEHVALGVGDDRDQLESKLLGV